MTHIGERERATARRIGALACLIVAWTAALASSSIRAEVDGRADWRAPVRTSTSSGEPRSRSEEPSDSTATVRLGRAVPAEVPTVANAPPRIAPVAPQSLAVGRRWRLYLRARDADGEPPRVIVRGLPDGARVEERKGGWHVLEWTPAPDAAGEIDLTVVAVDVRDPRLRTEHMVRLTIVREEGAPPSEAASAPLGPDGSARGAVVPEPDPTGDGGSPGSPPRAAPDIGPLASQIVSTGRTVTFRVAAGLADGREPLLEIDRLPRNASFDRNADGTRTFYWPTGGSDEGEHRFRVTARHPDDATLVSRVDFLVIVGDPSRSRTFPSGAEDPGARAPRDSPWSAPADGSPFGAGYADALRYEGEPSPDDDPFLPQAGLDDADYWEAETILPEDGFGYPTGDLPPQFVDETPLFSEPSADYFEPPEPVDGSEPAYGTDGLPLYR